MRALPPLSCWPAFPDVASQGRAESARPSGLLAAAGQDAVNPHDHKEPSAESASPAPPPFLLRFAFGPARGRGVGIWRQLHHREAGIASTCGNCHDQKLCCPQICGQACGRRGCSTSARVSRKGSPQCQYLLPSSLTTPTAAPHSGIPPRRHLLCVHGESRLARQREHSRLSWQQPPPH